jgi:hypothetical protein
MQAIRNPLTVKALRFVVGTVILGAVGSGAWEWVLKPSLVGISEFGLNVATLGVQSFKDSLYRDIAQGLHEKSSLHTFSILSGVFPGIFLGVFAAKMRLRKSELSETATAKVSVWGKHSDKIVVLMLLATFVFFSVQANQLGYVNRAVTHVQQLLAIVDPYIQENERLMYRSQFAQISSREDYVKLTNALTAACQAKSLKVPNFAVW